MRALSERSTLMRSRYRWPSRSRAQPTLLGHTIAARAQLSQ